MTDDTETYETGDVDVSRPAAAAGGGTRAWLQLIRLPALFTAFADVAAGFAAKTGGFAEVAQFAALLTASGCLYIAGMILNDVFDRHRDAASRPNRPIPSGRVSTRAASIVAIALIAAGIASAWSVSEQALYLSLGITACILAYDGLLKATPLGPLAMAACRFFNVMLGAATDDLWQTVWAMPQLAAAGAIGLYVFGVTWFARTEEKTSSRATLIGGAVVANLGMAILAAGYYGWPSATFWQWTGQLNGLLLACLVIVIALTIDRRLLQAIQNPSPTYVQAAVKLMLLSIITLDATIVLAATGAFAPALAVALLIVPAMFIGRWLYLT